MRTQPWSQVTGEKALFISGSGNGFTSRIGGEGLGEEEGKALLAA